MSDNEKSEEPSQEVDNPVEEPEEAVEEPVTTIEVEDEGQQTFTQEEIDQAEEEAKKGRLGLID